MEEVQQGLTKEMRRLHQEVVLLIREVHPRHRVLTRVPLPAGVIIAIQPHREVVRRAGVLQPIPLPAEAALPPVLLGEAAAGVAPVEVADARAVVADNRVK